MGPAGFGFSQRTGHSAAVRSPQRQRGVQALWKSPWNSSQPHQALHPLQGQEVREGSRSRIQPWLQELDCFCFPLQSDTNKRLAVQKKKKWVEKKKKKKKKKKKS